MPYNAFTIDRVRNDFGITLETRFNLFAAVPPFPLDPAIAALLARTRGLAVTMATEKAKSELLISPVLVEAWRVGNGRFSLLSGIPFNVDPAADLVGVCDFILGRPPQLDFVTNPVMMIAEAKNSDVMAGLGQCAAAMVAAQRFNAAKQVTDIPTIYGCVSNGIEWKFLRLTGTTLEVDLDDHLIHEPDRILGIILHFVGLAPLSAPAAA